MHGFDPLCILSLKTCFSSLFLLPAYHRPFQDKILARARPKRHLHSISFFVKKVLLLNCFQAGPSPGKFQKKCIVSIMCYSFFENVLFEPFFVSGVPPAIPRQNPSLRSLEAPFTQHFFLRKEGFAA